MCRKIANEKELRAMTIPRRFDSSPRVERSWFSIINNFRTRYPRVSRVSGEAAKLIGQDGSAFNQLSYDAVFGIKQNQSCLSSENNCDRNFDSSQLLRLKRFGGVVLSKTHVSLAPTCTLGYRIDIFADETGVMANFGGLMQDLPSTEFAVMMVERCFSENIILSIVYVRSRPVKWTLCAIRIDQREEALIASGIPHPLSIFFNKSIEYKSNFQPYAEP
jgi:hypothetical protein